MRTGMGKYLRKNKTKVNIPICIAAVLLCLTLFSTYLVTGLFARYATSAQGSDHARVAKFSIKRGGALTESIEADLVPGEDKGVTLIIENNSEVAVEYTVTVTNVSNNLPLNFRLVKTGDAPDVAQNGTTFTAQQIPGSHSDQYTLFIDWQAGDDDLTLMGMVDYITVTVTAAQID